MDDNERKTALRQTVERLSHKLLARDATIGAEFAEDATLAGSETTDLCYGAPEIARHFDILFERSASLRFAWDRIDASVAGDLGWIFAQGAAVITGEDGERHLPYRLSGVLAWAAGRWRWKLFHGSEPA